MEMIVKCLCHLCIHEDVCKYASAIKNLKLVNLPINGEGVLTLQLEVFCRKYDKGVEV